MTKKLKESFNEVEMNLSNLKEEKTNIMSSIETRHDNLSEIIKNLNSMQVDIIYDESDDIFDDTNHKENIAKLNETSDILDDILASL